MRLIHGDCLQEIKKLPDCSVDSCVCDPPYGINFMTKKWDDEVAFNTEVWSEVFRVLKHGGHLLSFGGCRTAHRMTVAIEDAGFIIRGMLGWAFSSGMPKSHNISLFIDKKKGLQGQRGKGGLDKFSGQAGQEMRKAKLYNTQE